MHNDVQAFLVAQNLPAVQKTWVQSLGWEDPLEKRMLPTPVFRPGSQSDTAALALYHGPHSVCFSLNLNKSTSYVSKQKENQTRLSHFHFH